MIISSDREPGRFSCEISDFGRRFQISQTQSFCLDGENVLMKLRSVEQDREGDTRWWEYQEIRQCERPRILTIFND